jgi:hypothetical protein
LGRESIEYPGEDEIGLDVLLPTSTEQRIEKDRVHPECFETAELLQIRHGAVGPPVMSDLEGVYLLGVLLHARTA